jgi:hypothetical protein
MIGTDLMVYHEVDDDVGRRERKKEMTLSYV